MGGRTGTSGAGRRAATLLAAVGVTAMVACAGTATPGARSGFAPTRILDVDQGVDELAADGSRAAFLWAGHSVDDWDVRTGKRRHQVDNDDLLSDLVIADGVFGYLQFAHSITIQFRAVVTWPLAGDKAGFSVAADLECARTCLGYLAGHGDLLVYNSWQNSPRGIEKAVLWRIVGTRHSSPRLGPFWRRYRFAHPVRTIRLGGESVSALLPQAIVVLDRRTGAQRRSWRVPKQTRLEDVAGGFVVYIVGQQIHVRRLADGRDRVVPLPDNARAPVHAQLELSGLFYSWTLPPEGDGRLAFAPMSRVAALFGA